jgi:uncharacterized membrane protein
VLLQLNSRRDRGVWVAAFAVVCVIPLYLWGKTIADLYAPGRTDIPIDPVAQSHVILAHPFRFLGIVIRTIQADYRGIYEWFVGTLGWGDTAMPVWYYTIFGWGFVACLIAESGHAKALLWRHRSILFGAAVAAVVLTFTAQYMSWNSPGSQGTIDGIEGRYFLPIAPFVILSFPPLWRLKLPAAVAPTLGITLGIVSAVVCLVAEIMRYYVA